MKLEGMMKQLHDQMNQYEQINGSILLRENGLHISSRISNELLDKRRVAANIANLFQYFKRINKGDEVNIQMNCSSGLYMKYIPSQKVILSVFCNGTNSNNLKDLINHFSLEFQNII